MGPNHTSAAEGGFTEESGQDRLWFLEGLDRVNQAIQDTDDLQQANHVVDTVLSIFGCDRAWIAYPCDPNSKTWRTVAGCGRPALAYSAPTGVDLPMGAAMASVLRVVGASEGPVCFPTEANEGISYPGVAGLGVRSQLCLAIHPKIDKPYLLGLDQCTHARNWTPQEQRLFDAIGRRIATLLTSLSLSRDLQESKARLEEAQRVAHVGHWDWNLETGEIIWSDEAYRIFGFKPQERPMDIETVSGLVHPDDREALYSTVNVEVAAGVHPVHQHRIVRPNGEVRTVQSITSMLWSALPGDSENGVSGEPHRLFGTVQDITELKHAEEARNALSRDLKESKEWLEEAQRVAHLGYWVWDLGTNQVIWSAETYRIFGLSPQVGSFDVAKVGEMMHPDDREAVFRIAEEAIRSGTRADCEHRLFRPDGEMRVVHSLGDLKKTAEGRTQMFGTTQDITERKRVEEERRILSSALEQSNARLEEAQRVAHIGHYEFNPAENHVTWSAELCRIWGLPPTKGPIGMALVSEMIHPEDREYTARVIEEAVRAGTHLKAEHRIVRPDGRMRFLQVLGTVKRDESGCAYELFGTCQDITDRKLAEGALQRSEFYLNEGQRLAHMGSWAFNATGFDYWSSELFEVHGLDPRGKPPTIQEYLDLVHAEDRAFLEKMIQTIMVDQSDFDFTKRIVRPDGKVCYVRYVGVPVTSGEAFKGFVGTGIDVTDQELLTQELRREQAYFSDAQGMAHIGSWVYNLITGKVVHSSDENARLYGFDPTEGPILGERFFATLHVEDAPFVNAALANAAREEADFYLDQFRIYHADGSIRFLRAIGHRNPSGEPGEYVGVTMDITERKRAEQEREALSNALQQSNAYLAEAQSLAHIGSWATNFETGEIHHISDETVRLHGFDPKQGPVPLERFFDTIHPEDESAVVAALKNAIRRGTDYDIPEFRICLSDGTIRFLRTIGHRDPSGEIGDYIGVTLDITDRKRAGEERERLRTLESDLAHINRVNMMGELAAALAHEIRQPIAASITSANACLRWLSHDPPDLERARAAIARIDREGNRAADIINSLRSFYKSGTPAKHQMVDVKDAIGDMIVLLNTEAVRHSVVIRSEFEPDVSCVPADRVQLQQVLMNLMLNAIEAMKETGGDLTVRARMNSEGQLIVSISDTGQGLPSENLELIFNPFHTTKPQGTGMGLTITRSIVEAYGGRVWATPNNGAGATFHFSLPGGTEAHG